MMGIDWMVVTCVNKCCAVSWKKSQLQDKVFFEYRHSAGFLAGNVFAATYSFLEVRKLDVLMIVDNCSIFDFLVGSRHENDV